MRKARATLALGLGSRVQDVGCGLEFEAQGRLGFRMAICFEWLSDSIALFSGPYTRNPEH